jgi:hypothetical protein
MSEKGVIEFVEEWQTGFFLLLGTVAVGVVTAVAVGSVAGQTGTVVGFLGGAVLAFLAFSVLLSGE